MNREDQLRREIKQIADVTAEVIAEAGDLLSDESVAPSNARAREEVIQLLGVNYVGPEFLNELFEPNGLFDRFKLAIRQLFKDRVIPVPFEEPQLDFVKLKEILNEADEWEIGKRKFETYALVFKPPRSFLELRDRANEAAKALGKTPAFRAQELDETEVFATEVPMRGSWELVRRETVPDSTDKDFDDQKELIADNQNLAPSSLPALAALLVSQYLTLDIKLYKGELHYGRTSTCAAFGPIDIGSMRAHGVDMDYRDTAHRDVGLSVSRNL